MNNKLKIGFVFYDDERDLDMTQIKDIAAKIGEPTTLTRLPFDGNRLIIGIHNASIVLEQELTQQELENVCRLFGPIYGDYDEMDDRMKDNYQNGILTLPINEFRDYLK